MSYFFSEKTLQLMAAEACKNGDIEIVKYYQAIGVECTKDAMHLAITHGHLEVVRYLYEIVGVEYTVDSISWASKHGYPEIAEYLHTESTKKKYTTKAKL